MAKCVGLAARCLRRGTSQLALGKQRQWMDREQGGVDPQRALGTLPIRAREGSRQGCQADTSNWAAAPALLLMRCAAQVKVKRRADDRKFLARVLAIGTECDIALLTGGWSARSARLLCFLHRLLCFLHERAALAQGTWESACGAQGPA